MKRILFMALAVSILLGSVSVFAMDSYYPDYEITAADEFRAVGLQISQIANPTDKLQNMMDFTFIPGEPVYRKYVSGARTSSGATGMETLKFFISSART